MGAGPARPKSFTGNDLRQFYKKTFFIYDSPCK